jgi:hypothetical protein
MKIIQYLLFFYILVVISLIGFDLYSYGIPTKYYYKCDNVLGCKNPLFCDVFEVCDLSTNTKDVMQHKFLQYNEEFGKQPTFTQKNLSYLLIPLILYSLFTIYMEFKNKKKKIIIQ